ncbi:hypothetical protein ACIRL2_32380 [Embleya sp. NPDC127516]|uniref:hypothetical protein n=1 Tax=Embleya sp. NPDC127516 TaxID=3363990 RepID=UPI00382A3AC3
MTYTRPGLTPPAWWPAEIDLDAPGSPVRAAAPVSVPSPATRTVPVPATTPIAAVNPATPVRNTVEERSVAGPPTPARGTPRRVAGPPPIPLAPGMAPGDDEQLGGGFEAPAAPAWSGSPAGYGWDFESDERGHRGRGFEGQEGRSRTRLVLAGLLLVTGITVAAVLLTGGDEPAASTAAPPPPTEPTEPPPPVASSSAAPGTATQVAPELLAEYQPRQVSRRVVDGRVEVSWLPPTHTDGVAGYMAVAQSPAGVFQKTELPRPGEMGVVFAGAPVSADSCVVVVTLIRGAPTMKIAPGGPVCGPPATGTPPSGASGSRPPPAKPASTPRG